MPIEVERRIRSYEAWNLKMRERITIVNVVLNALITYRLQLVCWKPQQLGSISKLLVRFVLQAPDAVKQCPKSILYTSTKEFGCGLYDLRTCVASV